jgi:hypothetical protein
MSLVKGDPQARLVQLQAHATQPAGVRLGPGGPGKDQPLGQQQLRQPMPSPHQVRAGVFSGPDQIPGRLLGHRRHPHPGQLPNVQQPGQPLSVAPVGLDPIPGWALQLRGATTTHPTPTAANALARPNPVGPAS